MEDLWRLSAADIAALITSKKVSAKEAATAALARLDPKHPPRRFAGITLEGRAIARHGQQVLTGGDAAGVVTSGTYSFTLDHSIATASLDGGIPADTPLTVDIRGTIAAATVVPLPFYRRPKGA